MKKANHKTRLIDYLKEYKEITSLEAIRDLGNTRLSASIFNLRKKGYDIVGVSTTVATRWHKKDGTRKMTTVNKYVFTELPLSYGTYEEQGNRRARATSS